MDLELLAAQLRKPEGDFGREVAEKMNQSNGFLYQLVFDNMEVQDQDSILEIGFGNGKFFGQLLSKADNLRLYGLDYSQEMLTQAISNNRQLAEAGVLDLKQGSSDGMPFADATFDKVFCLNVVYFWEDPAQHLREIHRVLKPGGKFYTGIRSKECMLKLPFTQFGFNLYSGEEWNSVLQQNNFVGRQTITRMEPVTGLDGESFQFESICFIAEKGTFDV